MFHLPTVRHNFSIETGFNQYDEVIYLFWMNKSYSSAMPAIIIHPGEVGKNIVPKPCLHQLRGETKIYPNPLCCDLCSIFVHVSINVSNDGWTLWHRCTGLCVESGSLDLDLALLCGLTRLLRVDGRKGDLLRLTSSCLGFSSVITSSVLVCHLPVWEVDSYWFSQLFQLICWWLVLVY